MDELYTESFFKTASEQLPISEVIVQPVFKETEPVVPVENGLVELLESSHQFNYYLDQLEKAISSEYENSATFRFFFSRIRANQKNSRAVYKELTEMEQLLDLS